MIIGDESPKKPHSFVEIVTHEKTLSTVKLSIFLCVCVCVSVFVSTMLAAAVGSLWSAGIQRQQERRLQDCSDGRDDRPVHSPLCAEAEREVMVNI